MGMTTPDIAGLCEKLRKRATASFEANKNFGRKGREWAIDTEVEWQAANILERQAAENKRLRGALEEAAKTLEHVDGALMDMAEAGAVPAVGTWKFVTKAARKARAALTGEDAPGSPTSQNTEPGLPFSDAGEP